MTTELAMKLELLRLLSEHDEIPVSEALRELGIASDELASMLNDLAAHYIIRVEKSRIHWSPGDNPRRIKPWGWNYLYKVITGSTMLSAKHMPPWSIVISEIQTQGKGRHGKNWISGLGGLWVTFKINTAPQLAQLLPIAIPVLLTRVIRSKIGVDAWIKWPNDIVYKDKKIAGILLEGEYKGSMIISYVGVGLNVNNDPPLEVAESLRNIKGQLIPRNRITSYLSGWMGRLDKLVDKPDELRREYLEHLSTIGRRVVAKTLSGEIIGVAKDISEYGELIVENDTGVYRLTSAEILQLRHVE